MIKGVLSSWNRFYIIYKLLIIVVYIDAMK